MKSTSLKRKLLPLTVCVFLTIEGQSQTNVIITSANGSQQTYTVNPAGKLYFENENLQVKSTDAAATISLPVATIRKVTFTVTNAALPLKLVDFTLTNQANQVMLSWKTQNEINTSHFIIEKSIDAIKYETLGQVAAASATSGSEYNFTDKSPKTGTSYYRLKQVDADGQFTYSKVLTLNRNTSLEMALFPNPAHNYISVTNSSSEKVSLKAYSPSGELILTGSYSSGEKIDISKFKPGTYIVLVNNKTYKLVKE